MLTGQFRTCPISSITINREDRQRKSLADIAPLAKSISERGLIHPPVLTSDLVLIAGERRVTACRSLGWTHIPYQLSDDLDPRELRLIELEENTHRVDISWQEENDAVAEIYAIYKDLHPDHTISQIAESINRSPNSLSEHLTVKAERKINPRVDQADTFRTAKTTAVAAADRRYKDKLSDVHPSPNDERTSVLNISFHEWAPLYTGPKFNFIHCDFPYGINAQDSSTNPAGYSDTPRDYLELCKTLAVHLDTFCAESAHMIFWCSAARLDEAWNILKLFDGFRFDEVPLIWHKSDGRGIAPDSSRRPKRVYETAFFGWRGDRRILKLKDNLFAAPTERLVHAHEKSADMLTHFFEMIVNETTSLLDPTCGSGSALHAARALGARHCLGLELSPDFAAAARASL